MSDGDVASPPFLPHPPAPLWQLSAGPDGADVDRLQHDLKLPRALCSVLAVRGFTDPEGAKAFLRPRLSELHPPGGLPDADRATERLVTAIRAGELVFVHGDYDVDGISGVALLTGWIRRLGGRAAGFVPHRVRDGYDFGEAGLRAARESGAALIVTVDCGITATGPVEQARSLGIDVIVSDHHKPGPRLPDALAVVNPVRADSTYPNPGLCGTGVAFKLCQSLAATFGVDDEELFASLDLVALATVADLVPLEGENRALVRYGLRAIRNTRRPGLRALLERTRLAGKDVDAGKIGFILAPRINAVGRMGAAATALRLLTTEDAEEAGRLAEELEVQNRVRREEDRRTLEEALDLLGAEYDPTETFGVVLAREGWHPGVIGIVASRVVERIHRPTVLVSLTGDSGRGSARSIPGFDLYDAIRAHARHLTRFGGHRQAAGMDLPRAEVDAFREAFNAEARRRLGGQPPTPTLRVDLELELTEVTRDLAHFGRYLGPFGIANRRPVFVARNVELARPPGVVKEEHLRLSLSQGEARLDAIGFGLVGRVQPDSLGVGPVDLAFQVDEREFRGRPTLRAKVLDVRPAGASPSPAGS